jgi:hypothetical protein
MAEIVIRKNRAGPQRFRYVLCEGRRAVVQSKMFRSRASAVIAARGFISIIKRGVDFHE